MVNSIKSLRGIQQSSSRKRQRGAVLFVALVLLLVLTLLGLTGVRVSFLQERMAGGWRAANESFQGAESEMREREMDLDAQSINAADSESCDPLNLEAWAANEMTTASSGSFVRRVDQCSPGGSLSMGNRAVSEETDLQFQIAAFSTDDVENPSSEAVLDSVFLPHPVRPAP